MPACRTGQIRGYVVVGTFVVWKFLLSDVSGIINSVITHYKLPFLKPIIYIAMTLRTIFTFGNFDIMLRTPWEQVRRHRLGDFVDFICYRSCI